MLKKRLEAAMDVPFHCTVLDSRGYLTGKQISGGLNAVGRIHVSQNEVLIQMPRRREQFLRSELNWANLWQSFSETRSLRRTMIELFTLESLSILAEPSPKEISERMFAGDSNLLGEKRTCCREERGRCWLALEGG